MTVKLSKEEKRRKKQFPLDNKLNCIIYLNKILTSGFLVMDKLKRYLNEEKEILEKNVKQEPLAWNIYCEQADKVGNCISFLANILGDAQGSSISYFKYRQNVKKRIADGTLHIPFYELTDTENQYLKEMNLFRNNYNHIPESILSSEVDLVKADNKACITANPLIYYIGKTVTQEVFEGLCEGHMDFKHRCNKLFQAVKKEYELLIGQGICYN